MSSDQQNAFVKIFTVLSPVAGSIGAGLNAATPILEKFLAALQVGWLKLQPYHPEEFLPAICGLLLCFFGGSFVTLIAAVEAYQMTGWTETRSCLLVLYDNYKIVAKKNAADDLKDEDGDGVADVQQISKQDLATRKLALVAKSCDPGQVSAALTGINTGLIAVIATLRVKFARAITLGASIGDVCFKVVGPRVQEPLQLAVPKEYHKWISPLTSYACKSVGISIAWFFVRALTAVHSSIRGGQLLANGVAKYLHRQGQLKGKLEDVAPTVELLGIVAAVIGFMWQLTSFFSLPFPLNVLLLPVTLVESLLTWAVADTSMFA